MLPEIDTGTQSGTSSMQYSDGVSLSPHTINQVANSTIQHEKLFGK